MLGSPPSAVKAARSMSLALSKTGRPAQRFTKTKLRSFGFTGKRTLDAAFAAEKIIKERGAWLKSPCADGRNIYLASVRAALFLATQAAYAARGINCSDAELIQ